MRESYRLHSFDALRAIVAIFGVVLHCLFLQIILSQPNLSLNHAIFSNEQSRIMAFFILWIHSFRLPIFFAISGFFSFYLFQRKGQVSTLQNRWKKIAIPFLVLWLVPILYDLFVFSISTIPHAAWQKLFSMNQIGQLGTFWFLYYLILIDLFFLLIIVPLRNIMPLFKFIKRSTLIFLLILGSCVSLIFSHDWYTPTDATILPVFSVLIYYGLFFSFGWIVAEIYPNIINNIYWQKWRNTIWIASLLISGLLFSGYFVLFTGYRDYALMKPIGEILFSSIAWISMLSLFAFCDSIANQTNKVWRYLADSAYWIYIAQMPIIMVVTMIFYYNKIDLLVSIPLVIAISLAVLLLSYQLLIRGRRYLKYISGS